MTPDTSTQAVEAEIDHLRYVAERTDERDEATILRSVLLLRALAAERDVLAKQLRSRLELLDSTAIRETRTSARRTALEDAAKVAKSLTVDTTGAVAEYMIGKADGMRFAAKEIYTAICALIEEE